MDWAVVLMCAHALSWPVHVTDCEDRFRTCMRVGQEARGYDLPPHIAISVAYTESRFNKEAVSPRGAMGPIQILPQYHCPNKEVDGCDLVDSGLRALRRYRNKYKNWADALCHWNSGNACVTRAKRFSRIVRKRARLLARTQGDK